MILSVPAVYDVYPQVQNAQNCCTEKVAITEHNEQLLITNNVDAFVHQFYLATNSSYRPTKQDYCNGTKNEKRVGLKRP